MSFWTKVSTHHKEFPQHRCQHTLNEDSTGTSRISYPKPLSICSRDYFTTGAVPPGNACMHVYMTWFSIHTHLISTNQHISPTCYHTSTHLTDTAIYTDKNSNRFYKKKKSLNNISILKFLKHVFNSIIMHCVTRQISLWPKIKPAIVVLCVQVAWGWLCKLVETWSHIFT